MEYTFDRNIIKIEQSELDIYDSLPLKELLVEYAGCKGITIDLSIVEELSTAAIQVILSALKTVKRMKVDGVGSNVTRDLALLGVKFHDQKSLK